MDYIPAVILMFCGILSSFALPSRVGVHPSLVFILMGITALPSLRWFTILLAVILFLSDLYTMRARNRISLHLT